jgi:squalene synthase HpnC
LKLLLGGVFSSDLDSALHETIKTKSLGPENFFRLLKAFKQDVTKHRYSDFYEVLEYCSNSANPVGRLVLELTGYADDERFVYSDKICTALQITNFIQDTVKDYEKGRIYYPLDEMQKFGVTEKMFELKQNNLNFKRLVEFSVGRVIEMFAQGKPLLNTLKGRIRYEIAWTIGGGTAILNQIRKNDYNVFNSRVTMSKIDYFRLFVKSFFFK